jgi:hypothetical protein
MHIVKRLALKMLDSFPLWHVIHAVDLMSHNQIGRRGMVNQAFDFTCINGVQGDYFEFGVWRGGTFCFAHRMKKRLRRSMKLWAFDSFAGLPAIDDEKYNVWKKGEYACSEPEFRAILRRNGVRDNEYEVVRGYYQDSLNDELHRRMQGVQAAIVYVDCDLYISTMQVLTFVSRYLVDGSIICFDDYYCYRGSPEQGEQRAIREFLASNPGINFIPYLDYSPVGKSFIVHLPAGGRSHDAGSEPG